MSTLVLPADSSAPSYGFELELEGALYRFDVHWNAREEAWFLSLYDRRQDLLLAGRKIVIGAEILGRSRDERLPPGSLLAIDTSGGWVDAGRDDLGERVQLVYLESEGP